MRARSLALSVAFVAGLLAVPLPALAGPTTCPANGLCVDESVEGQTPTLIAPAGFSTSITPLTEAVGEGWSVSFTFASAVTSASVSNFALTEPGSSLISDAIPSLTVTSSTGLLSFTLLSDNDLGQIATICCRFTAVEDGTFQFMQNSFASGGVTYDLYLKSDLDVPEPASLVLLSTALVGFGVIRRRRKSV